MSEHLDQALREQEAARDRLAHQIAGLRAIVEEHLEGDAVAILSAGLNFAEGKVLENELEVGDAVLALLQVQVRSLRPDGGAR